MAPLVSIVVLNYNGEPHLDACLTTLCAQTYQPLQVVVVDNGSTDRSAEVVARYDARWESLGANYGFSKGNNLGVGRCEGEFLVFVNNDMRFKKTFVAELLRPLQERSDVFATDARQRDWSDSRDIHLAARLIRRTMGVAMSRNSLLPLLDLDYKAVPAVSPAVQSCAANMAVRRRMFEALGGFDERLLAGWEDTEICWRAWLHGWPTLFVPNAVCWHKVGASSVEADGRDIRFRGTIGGRLVFSTKLLPWEHAVAAWVWSCAGLLAAFARGSFSEGAERARVLGACVRSLRPLLRERHQLHRMVGTTPRRQLRALLELGRTDLPGA